MAMVHEVPVDSRESMLEGFAKAFGRYPPRPPVPGWWNAFEEFYAKIRISVDHGDDRPVILRTDGFSYPDDNE